MIKLTVTVAIFDVMAPTFLIIRAIVIAHKLNKGFTRNQVVQYLRPKQANKRTIQTFIGKHAIGGGETPTLYFKKIAPATYIINKEYLDLG